MNRSVKRFLHAFAKAGKRPWTKQEFRQIAVWLAVNEQPLALLIEASKRPRRFDPLVGRQSRICFLSWNRRYVLSGGRSGESLRVPCCDWTSGRFDDAWQDLLACRRLAPLSAEGPSFVDYLVGIALDNIAFRRTRYASANAVFRRPGIEDARRSQSSAYHAPNRGPDRHRRTLYLSGQRWPYSSGRGPRVNESAPYAGLDGFP